jgi:hypothetical protein
MGIELLDYAAGEKKFSNEVEFLCQCYHEMKKDSVHEEHRPYQLKDQ